MTTEHHHPLGSPERWPAPTNQKSVQPGRSGYSLGDVQVITPMDPRPAADARYAQVRAEGQLCIARPQKLEELASGKALRDQEAKEQSVERREADNRRHAEARERERVLSNGLDNEGPGLLLGTVGFLL